MWCCGFGSGMVCRCGSGSGMVVLWIRIGDGGALDPDRDWCAVDTDLFYDGSNSN